MKNTASPLQRTNEYACYGNNHCLLIIRNSMFHRAFFDSIIDKHQHMHLAFNRILV